MKFILFFALVSSAFFISATAKDLKPKKQKSRSISSEERNCVGDELWNYDLGNENPFSENDYCSRTAKTMIRRLCFKSGRLGFSNEGGLFGLPTGVCWWNSQFHRKALYLTFFDPSDNRDISDEEFKSIIKKISNYEVVKIPKYKSFLEFVSDVKFPRRSKILKRFLQNKMAVGAILKGEWINGMQGHANHGMKKNPNLDEQREDQKKQFSEVYQIVRNPDPNKIEPAYVMLQEAGIVAHALIVYDAEIIKRDQYQDLVIYAQDSNYQTNDNTQRMVFYFDDESAQWFSESSYHDLQKFRKENTPYVIIREWTAMSKEMMKVKNQVVSQQWNIKVQHEKDNEKINQGFKDFCKRDLFY